MNDQDQLWQAAARGDKAAIRALALANVDFDARDAEDRTAFNIATQYGHHDAAKTILAAKQMKMMQAMGLTSEGFEPAQQAEPRRSQA
jgi:ankyrin repeat protein